MGMHEIINNNQEDLNTKFALNFILLFAVPLGYFLFKCGIFIKLSINQTLQSLKNNHLV